MWYWEIGRFLIGVDFASLDGCNEAGVKLCHVLMFLLTCTQNLPLQAIVTGTLLYVAVYMNWNSVALLSQFLNGMSNLVCALVTLNVRETLISIWYIFIFYIFCNFYLHFLQHYLLPNVLIALKQHVIHVPFFICKCVQLCNFCECTNKKK